VTVYDPSTPRPTNAPKKYSTSNTPELGAVNAVVCVAVSEMVMVLFGGVYAVTATKVMAVVVLACVVRP
jgi:hypothetical protein